MKSEFLVRFMLNTVFGNECWMWVGGLNGNGYGGFWGNRAEGYTRLILAHRWAYEYFRGPIPPGLVVDHLCREKRCVNPWHLEAVTVGENVRRGFGSAMRRAVQTECWQGHPFDAANTYVNPRDGHRHCRECAKLRMRSYIPRKLRSSFPEARIGV